MKQRRGEKKEPGHPSSSPSLGKINFGVADCNNNDNHKLIIYTIAEVAAPIVEKYKVSH